VARFEEILAEVCGARHAVAVSSGTAALHLAAIAAGVSAGRSGVTSAVTFVASANCIAYAGGSPSFADVDPTTGLIDLADLEARCGRLAAENRPPAVLIPVDLAGQPADLPGVRRIADRFGAAVVEDAAHSLGATYENDGREIRCGSCVHTEFAILSFHPVKHITTGEGGAVLTNDDASYRRLLDLRSHGITKDPERLMDADGPWYSEQHSLGFNYRITDFQCALGVSQASRLPAFLARRRELAARYDAAFMVAPFREHLAPLRQEPGRRNAYHLYVIRLRARQDETQADVAARRRALYDELARRGVRSQVHYVPVPRQPYYRHAWGTDPNDYPGAAEYYAGCLSLPLYPAMTDEDQRFVVEAVAEALGLP
jgi:dTDP-4-amino-4,6-dideoxygalactose transaminase